MRLISWNCQGLGNPWTSRSLHKIVREQAPTVCFLMETRLEKDGFENLYSNLPFQNKIIIKHPNAEGGLTFLWKNTSNLEIINYTTNHVLAVVTEEDGFRWFLTGFYGWSEAQQKERSWRLLEYLKTFVEGPWIVIRDFKAFYTLWKRKAGGLHKLHRLMHSRKLWSLANFKTLALRVIHLHGITRDWGKQIKHMMPQGPGRGGPWWAEMVLMMGSSRWC